MPVIIRADGFRFFFYSNEGNPREPIHIHVRKAERLAKFWLDPILLLAENHGFTGQELRIIRDIIRKEETRIREAWHGYFND